MPTAIKASTIEGKTEKKLSVVFSGKGIVNREMGEMHYKQLKKNQMIELCREREISPEERMKSQLADLLFSNEKL